MVRVIFVGCDIMGMMEVGRGRGYQGSLLITGSTAAAARLLELKCLMGMQLRRNAAGWNTDGCSCDYA